MTGFGQQAAYHRSAREEEPAQFVLAVVKAPVRGEVGMTIITSPGLLRLRGFFPLIFIQIFTLFDNILLDFSNYLVYIVEN
ncbi:hypothetical protein D3C76_1572250 [compost metagenome]